MRATRRIVAIGSLALAATLVLACSSTNNNSNKNTPVGTVTQAATQAAPASATVATTQAPRSPAAAGSAPAGSPAASSVPMCPPSGSANALTGAGSTFDSPLFSKLFDLYNQQCKVQVNYQSVGSGAGIQQLTAKTVQFGATDAPMTDDQINAAGGDVLHIPVTIGAVPVGYNLPGVKSGVKLSGDVLAKIFLGQITRWSDPAIKALNAGMNLPDLDIAVVHRSDGSGTSFI
ncbi:MAG TPA: phosphate ABC transporter substrate-binding protein PstS, partial [Dehalococcoidia bacterium]|nr:phosphate ABC transporter substrate-binding protein PstS [Dehalococcoidia bacterium]